MADDDTPGDDLRGVLGMSARRAPAVLAPGQVIDDAYRIEEEIGAGGVGRVYRARDLRLGRDVAIKLHGFAIAPDDDTLQREATALARLTHPNVVRVYEVGRWTHHPWVAMEYVRGGTVRTWLRAKPRSTHEILTLFIAAGRGLAAAHAAGLVHRDFKPDNVLVGDDGRICVADFGLAHDAGDARVGDVIGESPVPPSGTGVGRGTPAYMAPEQRDAARVDAAADQFAFGVSLWEALTTSRPFGQDYEVTAPPAGRMPRHVETALRRAMAKAPAERWPAMSDLLAELARDPARTRFLVGAGLVAVLALVGGGYAIAMRVHSPGPTCDAGDQLTSTWTLARREAVQAAYPGELGTRVIGLVDVWAGRWIEERNELCKDTTLPAQLVALREACLDRARVRLGATLETLATKLSPADALTASTSLPRLPDCADTALLTGAPPPVAPNEIASTRAVEAMLALADAWIDAGVYKRALSLAREAVTYTDRLGLPVISARAQFLLADANAMTGPPKGVLEQYEAAARLAAQAHDDVLVAEIYLAMLQMVTRSEKLGEIDRILEVASTAIERANRPPTLVERLGPLRADIARVRGDHATALALYEQSAREYEARYGEDQRLARALTTSAQVLIRLHRHADARAALERASAIMHRLYGDLHPNLGVILTTLGSVEMDAGDLPAAIATFERAVALKEAALGPQHPGLIPPLVNLSQALRLNHELAKAVPVAARTVTLVERGFPPGHPKIVLALTSLGIAQLESGDWSGAATSIDRAVAAIPADSTDPGVVLPLRTQARIYFRDGKLDVARVAASRALAVATGLDPTSEDAARCRLVLAQIDHDPKEFRAALDLLRQRLGPTHPEVLSIEQAASFFGSAAPDPR